MSFVEALVLGIVQGLTEFLPISSTAHLRVVPALCGWSDPGVQFSAIIQLGSVIAVLAYFAKDIIEILKGFMRDVAEKNFAGRDMRLVCGIVLGTIPICVAGLAMKTLLETEGGPLRQLTVIGYASIVMGGLLFMAEQFGKRQRTMDGIGVADGLLIGFGQAMALIPGCSRSGSTLTAALLIGLKREDAARFSFLLGIPAIILSGLLELKSAVKAGFHGAPVMDIIVGLAAATVVSYAAIWWMLKFLRSHSTLVFVIYRFVFGIAVVSLAVMHKIH